MPYIKPDRREVGTTGRAENAGELNYVLTQVIRSYWLKSARNYQAINDISGAMTEALAEFRRRVVADYEDSKIRENGDVYF